ncbi:hypothetical protein DPX16_8395 [Anabarilius grahami]|uniref:Uncharacterized protein n=1 Tax=Anabarilius grahami TaxID=495550 RepID=A0A3N0Z3H8_ANAGA|nr:hypothetical protein DPX16_8395 [Anabarilius grahami]
MTKDFLTALDADPDDIDLVSVDADMKIPEAFSTSTTLELIPTGDSREPESLQTECQRNQLPDSPSIQILPEMTQIVERRKESESALSGCLRRSVRERKPPAYLKDFVT